jgi:cellulose synthase/poly-beta-1,6-N-acetylglucosamine synthase-like glycosyltransferase
MHAALSLPALWAISSTLSHALGLASLVLAVCALLGTLYALAFSMVGIWIGRRAGNKMGAAVPDAADATNFGATNFLVCIPAHNEGPGLRATVDGVLRQAYPRENIRCVVIADNCTDDTAQTAAECGAHVLVRNDAQLRGKGHALAWAFRQPQEFSWDAVCIVDADSVMEPGFLAAMDAALRRGHSVVQARYDFVPADDGKNWLELFTAVSKAAENSFVYRSRERMGLLQLLQGNGICIRRAALEQVPWRAHSIVEDAEYALELGRHGIPVHYQEVARIWSRQATTVRDVQPQRIRWASGTWQLFRQGIPSLLVTAWKRKSLAPLEGIVMLLTTSRLLLIYLLGLSLVLAFAAPQAMAIIIARLLALVVGLQFLYLVLMFRFASDRPAPWSGLLSLPFYVAVVASSHALAMMGFNRKVWWRTSR